MGSKRTGKPCHKTTVGKMGVGEMDMNRLTHSASQKCIYEKTSLNEGRRK